MYNSAVWTAKAAWLAFADPTIEIGSLQHMCHRAISPTTSMIVCLMELFSETQHFPAPDPAGGSSMDPRKTGRPGHARAGLSY
jgi:hypothetical protein